MANEINCGVFVKDPTRSNIRETSTVYGDVQVIVKKKFQDFVCNGNLIVVPNTLIQNRADIPDIRNDLSLRMGINRVMTQQIELIEDEFGACGEPVHRAVNDEFDQIRFVGSWVPVNGQSGSYLQNNVD